MGFHLMSMSCNNKVQQCDINFLYKYGTRGGITIEFSEMRGPNEIFGSFCRINEQNILFGPLISENSIVTPPLIGIIVLLIQQLLG